MSLIDDTLPPISAKLLLLEDLIEAEAIPWPSIVWPRYLATQEAIVAVLRKAGIKTGVINGSMSSEEKDKVEQLFHDNKLDAIVPTLGSWKFGVNLPEARSTILYDRTFNADDTYQAIHRMHRMTTKHEQLVITLKIDHYVEDLVDMNLDPKYKRISELSVTDLKDFIQTGRMKMNDTRTNQ